jgi:pimeloyl-ACP methyl ester carboxylesterase
MRSVPPETVLWRLSLIKEFNVDPQHLRSLTQPVLLLGSASDQLLPSVTEVNRLANILPNAKTLVLPYSGHACLLEKEINLYEIMAKHDFLQNTYELLTYSP